MKISTIKRRKVASRSERVFAALKARVLDMGYEPGESLTEMSIARDLGVSRTPIREALRRLEGENLLRLIPRKGAIVIGLTEGDIRETYLIREALEGICARRTAGLVSDAGLSNLGASLARVRERLAAGDRDGASDEADEMHRVILEVGGTPRIRKIVEGLREMTGRLHAMAMELPGRLERSIEEHARVVEALRARDGDAAERLIREHIASTEEDVLKAFRNRNAARTA